MTGHLTRETCSHAPLEILRQDALHGDWNAAKRDCFDLDLPECASRAELELVFAVWAQDAVSVAAAVAQLEKSNPREAACWRQGDV
ncbi:MAG: hypothetical protein O3A53_07425 [Acidobacteria bacterium]|nr:hypothetical protein [Acidobacteriota bacterium]